MQLKSVVLPAPFGPMRPMIVPFGHLERDIGVGGETAEELADVPDLEDGHRRYALTLREASFRKNPRTPSGMNRITITTRMP